MNKLPYINFTRCLIADRPLPIYTPTTQRQHTVLHVGKNFKGDSCFALFIYCLFFTTSLCGKENGNKRLWRVPWEHFAMLSSSSLSLGNPFNSRSDVIRKCTSCSGWMWPPSLRPADRCKSGAEERDWNSDVTDLHADIWHGFLFFFPKTNVF